MTKTTIPTLITAGLGGHGPVQPAVTTNYSFSSIASQQVQSVGGDVVENQTLRKETIKLAKPTIKGKRLWRTSKDQGYSDEWYTPMELVESLGRFDVDPCAARLSGVNLAKRNIRLPKMD